MTFLPIVERELRVAARQAVTYRARLSAVVLAGFFALPTTFFATGIGMGMGTSPGAVAFHTLAALAFFYCLFAGAYATADSLSGEKRDGTLGFLFLTDLKGYDIVLGKLLANALRLFYGLLATVPVLAIPLMQGGVRAGEFWRQVLVLLNTMFFSAALGLLVSSWSRQTARAVNSAALLMLFFWLGLPALGALSNLLEGPAALVLTLNILSPSHAQDLVNAGTGEPFAFWSSLLVTHALAWGFLGLAARTLPRAWQDQPTRPQSPRAASGPPELARGQAAARRRFRTRLLDKNPYFWLVARPRWKPLWPWGVFTPMAALAVYFLADNNIPLVIVTVFVLHLLLKFWLAAAAVAPIAAHRRGGTLEVLLATPLTVADLLRGHWLALCRQFLGPVLMVATLSFLLLALGLSRWSGFKIQSDFGLWWCVVGATSLMLIADAIAIGWGGMWLAISAKQVQPAAGQTLTRILFLPWLFLILLTVAWGLISLILTSPPFNPGPFGWLGLWFILGLGTDIFYSLWARRQLRRQFRYYAAMQYATPVPSRWWRWLGQTWGRLRR